jgi:hypothetical protein
LHNSNQPIREKTIVNRLPIHTKGKEHTSNSISRYIQYKI